MVKCCLYKYSYSPFALWIWCQMTSLTIITLAHAYILTYTQLFTYMKINDYVSVFLSNFLLINFSVFFIILHIRTPSTLKYSRLSQKTESRKSK